jgi:pilus assembly protein CpaF
MAALTLLVDRIGKATSIVPFAKPTLPNADVIQKLEQVSAEQAKTLTDVSAGVVAQLVEAARREFLEIGPIGPWLDDPEISQIQCLRHNKIDLTRNGKVVPAEIGYSNGSALHRALVRLAKRTGKEWTKGELVVEGRLPNGNRLTAIVPPLNYSKIAITIRKREPVMVSMAELVAGHALSDGMATFLTRCVRARVNLIVCGEDERGILEVIAALASVAPVAHRVVVLHAGGDVRIKDRRTISVGLPDADEEKVLRAAMSLGHEQLLVLSPKARIAAGIVTTITAGASGVVLGLPARTLEKGLALTTGELMLSKPGLPHQAASLLVARAMEIGLELKTVGSRPVIVRLAEIEPPQAGQGPVLRDLFVMTTAEDGKDVVFAATGSTSRNVVD